MRESEAVWAVAVYGPATAKEIASEMGMSSGRVYNAVSRAYDRGLLDREKGTPSFHGKPPHVYSLSEKYER